MSLVSKALDQIRSTPQHPQTSEPRYGEIIGIYNVGGKDQYAFKFRILKSGDGGLIPIGETSGYLRLSIPIEQLMSIYGSPQDIQSKNLLFKIEYTRSVEKGVAYPMDRPGLGVDNVELWNQMAMAGTTFAPPGSGMV